MYKHPFIETQQRKLLIVVVFCLSVLLYAGLLCMYTEVSMLPALTDGLLSIGALFALGFLFWFIIDVIHIYQAELILSLIALVVWLVATFLIQFIEFPMDRLFFGTYVHMLPLRVGFGLLMWLVLLQWYRVVKLQRWKRERLLTEAAQVPMEEIIDRIAVKNGTRIHVIPVKDLVHVQACGDYVMLYTPQGEFLKEQTMKSLETHLPTNFVRIHRSFIVNVEQIDRVELYAKETYHVLLKNGTTLRASISGYKQLKELLAL